MNQRTNNSRWFCQSDIAKNKLPQSTILEIRENTENLRTYETGHFEQGYSPIGELRAPERIRYINQYGGATEHAGDRGGETNAQ